MSNQNQAMLKRLRVALKQLDIAKKAQKQMSVQLIDSLPEDKRSEASELFSKAKKGQVDISELMAFAGNISAKDKEELKKNVEKVNDKAEEVGVKKSRKKTKVKK